MIVAAWQVLVEIAPWLWLGVALRAALLTRLSEGPLRRKLAGRWGLAAAHAAGGLAAAAMGLVGPARGGDPALGALAAIAWLLAVVRYALQGVVSGLRPHPIPATLTIPVEGMTCSACAGRVGDAARAVEGVTAAVVRLDEGLLVVDGAADRAAVCEAVRKAGYRAR